MCIRDRAYISKFLLPGRPLAVFRCQIGPGFSLNSQAVVYFYDQAPSSTDYSKEVLSGLRASQKYISPKFFYDERGSELFTEITCQPEYYLTETEIQLLRKHSEEISSLMGREALLIEYGSGSSTKIRILLESLRPSIYAPLDISKDYLVEAAQVLASDYPWLEVHATCVDFTTEFKLPFQSDKRRISFFPGSSIGNFEPQEAKEFLIKVRRLVGHGGGVLLGVDLKKDMDILNAAYNDHAGFTSLFNLNILRHLNNLCDADFSLDRFEHEASYNAELGCMQMFLISRANQLVEVAGESVAFMKGEKIHTENSYKYSTFEIEALAKGAGFKKIVGWTDRAEFFGLYFLTA